MAKGIKGSSGKGSADEQGPFRAGTRILNKGWKWQDGQPVRADA